MILRSSPFSPFGRKVKIAAAVLGLTDRIEVVVVDADRLSDAARALHGVATAELVVDADQRRVSASVTGGSSALVEAIRSLDAAGVLIADIVLRRPTLDDVFLTLTGHAAEEDAA